MSLEPNQLRSAEAVLDGVGLHLHQNGGSAETFKEFQIESVRVLTAMGRPTYALAAYGIPCILQLKPTGAVWLQRQAIEACRQALLSVREKPEENPLAHRTSPFWLRFNSPESFRADPFNSLPLLPTETELETLISEILAGRRFDVLSD